MNKVWNDRYDREDYYYGTKPNDFLLENAKLIKPSGTVLCLAEGEGRNAVFLAKSGFQVTAVDFSAVALSKLEKLAAENKVHVATISADLAEFEIEKNHWDGIVSIWCHVGTLVRRPLHQKVVSGLKQGGVLIFEAYTPDQIPLATGGPKDPDLLSTSSSLKSELVGLQFKKLQELQREIHEGAGHNGISAVVQAVGIKV